MKKFFWFALVCLVLVVVIAGVFTYAKRPKQAFHGSQIDPPMAAPDFTLTSQSSALASLSDFRGKYTLLFFGYTNCPDICPATMGVLMQVKDQLQEQADKVQVVLVTTDPEHDTPQALDRFINRFDPSFVGLTGSKADLARVWRDYGVAVEDDGMTHSSRVYLVDPEGNIPLIYPSATSAEYITADLTRLLNEN